MHTTLHSARETVSEALWGSTPSHWQQLQSLLTRREPVLVHVRALAQVHFWGARSPHRRNMHEEESEQLAYLREHQPALETVLSKAVGATINARTNDPMKFLVTHLADAAGLIVRSRPSRRLREVGFKAMAIGATVREVVGLRQWIPDASGGSQDEDAGSTVILVERYKSIARDTTFAERVVHPAVRVAGHEAELARMLEHGTALWDFDTLRLTVISGGHALLALGWSLFERHRLRDELGLTSDVVLGFLSHVEKLYTQVPATTHH